MPPDGALGGSDRRAVPDFEGDARAILAGPRSDATFELCSVCGDWADADGDLDIIILCEYENCLSGVDALGRAGPACVHIHCMRPVQRAVPKEAWFCSAACRARHNKGRVQRREAPAEATARRPRVRPVPDRPAPRLTLPAAPSRGTQSVSTLPLAHHTLVLTMRPCNIPIVFPLPSLGLAPFITAPSCLALRRCRQPPSQRVRMPDERGQLPPS